MCTSSIKEEEEEEDLCDLCARPWVFIISSGRAGSTTILTTLNHLNGSALEGEEWGLLNKLKKVFTHKSHNVHTNIGDRGPFFHNPPKSLKHVHHQVLCHLQSLYKAWFNFEPNAHITGIKEIRYNEIENLLFLHEIFPCARFIINARRDLTAQARGWQKAWEHPRPFEILIDMAQNISLSLKHFTDNIAHKKQVFRLDIEDFTADNFNALFQWLHFDDCKISHVPKTNHNWINEDTPSFKGECRFNQLGFQKDTDDIRQSYHNSDSLDHFQSQLKYFEKEIRPKFHQQMFDERIQLLKKDSTRKRRSSKLQNLWLKKFKGKNRIVD